MQPGKPLHRSTVWRQSKRLSSDSIYSGDLRGRRWSGGTEQRGFWEFTAAVVSLVTEKGYCDYNDLFPVGVSGSPRGYHPARPNILAKIQWAAFPAAMMAVAICEIIPLNFITRGGPDSSSESETQWKARAKLKAQAPILERIARQMRDDGASESEVQKARAELAQRKPDELREIFKAMLGSELTASDSASFAAWGNSSKGTPAHRVNYCYGVTMSRAMASYWRNHKLYRKCKEWLRSMLPAKSPNAPYRERIVYVPKLVNASFNEYMKKRRRENVAR